MINEHLEFRYFGFYAALKRYRATTLIGWGVTTAGMAGFITSWGMPGGRGLLDVILALAVVLAGVTVVQVSVTALQSYVSVPFPPPPDGLPESERAAVDELEPLIAGVRDGGWQEAFHAIREVRGIGTRRELPSPDRRGQLFARHHIQET